jgi:hypothetical protein
MRIKKPNEEEGESDTDVAIARGMRAELLNLYEGYPKCPCCINWAEEFPDDVKGIIEAVKGTQQYAVLLRSRKCHKKGAMRPLELDLIVVHSPLIKTVLHEKVFHNYPGITATLEKLEFSAPFAPFLHRWSEFQMAYEMEDNDEVKTHLSLLYVFGLFARSKTFLTIQIRCYIQRYQRCPGECKRHVVQGCHNP